MKKLKINIPKGFEINAFNKETGDITFKKTVEYITDKIKTFDDVLNWHRRSKIDFNAKCQLLIDDEVAYIQLKLIVACLNEGWRPDWGDGDQHKYFPRFNMGGSSGSGFAYYGHDYWTSRSDCGSHLYFKNPGLAEYAGIQFVDIYKKFML